MPALAKARIAISCTSSRGDTFCPPLHQEVGGQQRCFVAALPLDAGDQRVRDGLDSRLRVNHAALVSLSRDDLIAVILAQAEQISALTACIAKLEAKLAAPAKTPDNSSLPPSQGNKPNLPEPGRKKPRPSRARWRSRTASEAQDTVSH
jgi:hypothetical protein